MLWSGALVSFCLLSATTIRFTIILQSNNSRKNRSLSISYCYFLFVSAAKVQLFSVTAKQFVIFFLNYLLFRWSTATVFFLFALLDNVVWNHNKPSTVLLERKNTSIDQWQPWFSDRTKRGLGAAPGAARPREQMNNYLLIWIGNERRPRPSF